MGNARWSADDYTRYSRTTSYQTKSRDEVFSHKVNEKLDPRNVKVGKGPRAGQQLRESIISEENPNPTPIILGLDVTGSMGAIAEEIAKFELPKLMTQIHETGVVSDPHVMFMGIDDVFAQGWGALQVSYFEPDLRIVEQLRQMWLVGNGGGNGSESYDLAWYFAAHHTHIDCFEKQGRKGFLFTFGDEGAPFETLRKCDLETIFGPGSYENTTPESSLRAAKERYSVFHITLEHGPRQSRPAHASWTKMLGNNALLASSAKHITDIVLATMAIVNGADIHEVIQKAETPEKREALTYAFQNSLKG